MSPPAPSRIVDAHVHFWDPARADWYPYLAGAREIEISDVSGMARYFDEGTYAAESAGWRVEKVVHIAAADSAFTVEETLERQALSDRTGIPAAIIGGIAPTVTPAEVVDRLDRQQAASRFRGVRPMGGPALAMRPDSYRELRERGLVFEALVHPDEHALLAEALAPWDGLSVVIEHMGWPRSSSAEEFALWRSSMARLAGLGEHVHCKLSGLPVPLGTMAAASFAPWFEVCLDQFGIERCLFASNFPVDGMAGSFAELYGTYTELAAGLDDESRDKLFATNAERVYRC